MKSTLIMAIVDVIFVILMVACIIFDIAMANWPALAICVVALILNIGSAIRDFKRWRTQRAMDKLSIMACHKYTDI